MNICCVFSSKCLEVPLGIEINFIKAIGGCLKVAVIQYTHRLCIAPGLMKVNYLEVHYDWRPENNKQSSSLQNNKPVIEMLARSSCHLMCMWSRIVM